ncbi:MAG: autotransporter domain-containing protein [Chthoniobacterales bacterium]
MTYSPRRYSLVLAAAVMAAIHPGAQAVAPDLGAASSFAVLGGSTVTNTGVTNITGDLGVSPGSAVTGFPPGVVTGTIYANVAPAIQAHADTITAYNTLTGETANTILTGQDLGGLTLTPGTYFFATSAQLTGTLTLDPQGDPNAKFHFQIGSTLTTASASSVIVSGGGSLADIFWQVGSSAILGSSTAFEGNILAQTSITLNTGAGIVAGRALAIDGAVTLDTNNISFLVPPNFGTFWKGANGNLWSQNNWSSDATGVDDLHLPITGANVVFSVTGVTPVNQNTVLDFDANIDSLTINDPAAVTISGSNTLTIAGTGAVTGITVNSGAGLATIATNIVLAGASDNIAVNNAAGLLISGNIGGAIGLTKSGTGKLTVTGANSYTGATVISGGTLQVGDGTIVRAALPAASAVTVAAPGTLAINLTDGKIFSNTVANSGVVTTIAEGTNTLSGVISGTGSFHQNGTGITILSGQNTFTGLTRVSQGTLFVDGAVGGSSRVDHGTLGGSGSIAGNVTALNDSKVSAGTPTNPAGTLRVGGNYQQGPGTTYTASLTGPNTNNLLAINGRARLNGTLHVNYIDGFNASPGEEFTVLTSRGGVAGRFSEFDDSHATDSLLTLGVFYRSNSVLLKFTQGSFLLPEGLTPNQIAIATALDKLAGDDSTSRLIAALDRLPIDQLPGAYDRLSPVEFAAIFDSGFAIAREQSGFIERRLEDVRDNSRTEETTTQPAQAESDGKTVFDDKDGKHMIAPEGKNVRTREVANLAPERRWGFYLNGGAEFVNIDSTSRAAGSDFNVGSANLGADYLLTNHVVIGATVGYSHVSSDGSNGGEVTGDGANGNLYASWFDHGFYVNGIVGGGLTSYDTERRTIGGTARGDTDGSYYTALIGTGYEHHIGGLTFGPIAALQYTTVSLDGFTETGSLAPLRISDQTENSLQSRLGLRASYAWKVGGVVITPEVRAQWQHEFQDTSRGITAGFTKDSSFTVRGPEIGRDSLLLDAGASVQWCPRVSTYAYYTGNLGATNYSSHSVNVGVRVSF